MTKLSTPDRGQPLDVSYIADIVDVVNDLSVALGPAMESSAEINTAAKGTLTMNTSKVRMVGGFVSVTNTKSTTLGHEENFELPLTGFLYDPIVTATPILTSDQATLTSKDITVTLTSVSTGSVRGVVKFNTIGVASVGINLIVIGVPKSYQGL